MKSKNATTADRALQKSQEPDRPSRHVCSAVLCPTAHAFIPLKNLKPVRRCSETGGKGKMIFFHNTCY